MLKIAERIAIQEIEVLKQIKLESQLFAAICLQG